ncbi:NAD(P)H-quinone oxidoreductase [soil metagenome]
MRAVIVESPGGPEALSLVELPDPVPEAEELLIQVACSSVNRADILQRRGMYPPPPGASQVLGLEVAGTVVGLGAGVDDWQEGDQVCAVVAGGGYATMAAIPAAVAMPLPPGVELNDAAAVPEVFTTAYDALVMQAGLSDGETVLLHGGSSGVGTAGIQLAKRAEADVVVTVGTDEKADACRELGADLVINYRQTDDFAQEIRDRRNSGVDVLLDIIGGPYLAQNLSVLDAGGRMVTIGLMGGPKAELNMGLLMAKRLTLMGSTLRARPVEQKAVLANRMVAEVWPGFVDGSLVPIIHSRYRLDEVSQAHAEMEASTHVGKILLTCTGSG